MKGDDERARKQLLFGCALASLAFLLLLAGLFCPDPARAGATVTGIACQKSAIYDTNTNGATQLVAAGAPIYVCGYTIATAAAVNVGLVTGTGTNCGTGQVKITPAFVFQATTAGIAKLVDGAQQFRGLVAPAGQALCINTSAGSAVQAIVYFDQ